MWWVPLAMGHARNLAKYQMEAESKSVNRPYQGRPTTAKTTAKEDASNATICGITMTIAGIASLYLYLSGYAAIGLFLAIFYLSFGIPSLIWGVWKKRNLKEKELK